MGLFSSLFGSKTPQAVRTPAPQKSPHQDGIERIATARQQYKEDNDINKLISVYEDLFVKQSPPLRTPDEFELAKLYQKAGMTDKAWGYLNTIIPRGNTPLYLIYNEQATILKRENRYADALHTYMLCYQTKVGLLGASWEEKFRKEIGVCVHKLKWSDDTIDTLTNMIKAHIQSGDLEICNISSEFKSFYERTK